MTQNQIAYWNYVESARANRAKERENFRSNRAREVETVRSNRASEKELNRSNQARELENVRSNTARERETRRSNLAHEVELGRHNAYTEQIARDTNRITADRNREEANYRERKRSDDYELGLLNADISRFKANTERARSMNQSLSDSERNALTRDWNAVQAELQRLGIRANTVSNILNIFGRLGGGFLGGK